jgi:2-desacetyl-2-hydroxyethyl bacteriochlorophyllide A dehydrogenase
MLVYRGQVSPSLSLDLPTLAGSFAFPIKYGYASVGRVVDVGSMVTSLRVGDLTFCHHPHQTEYVVEASRLSRLSSDLDPDDGIFLANVETAVNVALDAHPHFGDRVAIFGQGVVGLIVAQLMRRSGASLVIAVDPLASRRDVARRVGADHALPPDDGVVSAIHDLTDGLGVDLAIEASGNPGALNAAIDSVTPGGTIVVCSWYGTKTVPVNLGGSFHRGRIRIISSQVGAIDGALQPRWSLGRRMTVARDLLGTLNLKPLISHRFALESAADAYDLIERCPADALQVTFSYR